MYKKLLIINFITCILCLSSCSKKNQKIQNQKDLLMHQRGRDIQNYIVDVNNQKIKSVENYIQLLSLEEKIAQLFIINLEGNKKFYPVETLAMINPDNPENEKKPLIPGGYLYFSFNIADNPLQLIEYNLSLQKCIKEINAIPPFLSVDQEGGYVNRLRELSGPLPSCERVAKRLNLEQANQLYSYQALQMKHLGFNMNLAPVVEVCTDENSQFLMQRSFGSLEQVLTYGKACINAYEQNGIATVLKHFPGNTNTDPHTGLPEIKKSEYELNDYLASFRLLVKENPTGVLMSHARVTSVDEKVPSCLSEIWVTQILRKLFNYDGIIFSDDIFMGALADNGYPPNKAVVMAIEAGIDCIMSSEKRLGNAGKVLYKKAVEEPAFAEKIDNSVKRIVEYKIKNNLLKVELNPKGQYEVMPVVEFSDSTDLLKEFDKIKQENIKFYKEYF